MSKYLSLYVNACRCALCFDVRDSTSLTELAASLTAARHAMMCCVCGRLLKSPTGPTQSTCHHYYCRACVGGKTRYMKGGCGWCKDTTAFVADSNLESVTRCFRQLCVYLNSFISSLAKNGHDMDTVLAIVHEAVEKQDSANDIPLTLSSSHSDHRSHTVSSLRNIMSPSMSKISQDSRRQISKSNSIQRSSVKRKRKHQLFDSQRKSLKPHGITQAFMSPSHGSVNLCVLPNAGGNVSDLQLDNSLMDAVTWSDSMGHSHLHDADHHIDVEETLVGGIYDTRWSLLENPVLAEHDYNKLTSSFNAANAVPASSVVSVSSSKLPRLTTAKKSGSKRASADKGSCVRKPSLTIRQLSEGNSANGGGVMKIAEASVDGLVPRRQKSSAPKVKIGCRCAMATPAPGKLTCCGQRCPCYAAFHGCCPSCKCRGCRNPRGDPAKAPVLSSTMRPSSLDQVQCNLPLFDSTGAVYSSVNKDDIVVHSPARFTTESVGC